MSTTLESALVADPAAQVFGSVLRAQDAGYEAARTVHDGLDRQSSSANGVDLGLALVPASGQRVEHDDVQRHHRQ